MKIYDRTKVSPFQAMLSVDANLKILNILKRSEINSSEILHGQVIILVQHVIGIKQIDELFKDYEISDMNRLHDLTEKIVELCEEYISSEIESKS